MTAISVPRLLAAVVLLISTTACVSKGTHQTTLNDLSQARLDHDEYRAAMESEVERLESELADAMLDLEATADRSARTEEQLSRSEDERARAEARLEQALTEVQRLEILLSQQGGEYRLLQQRLQSLAAIEQEVRQRNAIYEEVIGRFRSLIEGGRLSVSINRGRMVIQLPQDILFGSGNATIGADGRGTLTEVAAVLAELPDRKFQIEGHTDNVPIATARFPSNWELSTARALSVVRLLAEQSVPPENLSGAGFGEFQPAADNETPEGRRRNRRIEIVMLPNLDVIAATELPATR